MEANQIRDALQKTDIIPDALEKAPKYNASIDFYYVPCGFGKVLTAHQVKFSPTGFHWPHDDMKLYTLVMTDLDYPTKKKPSGREFVLWIIGNIAGDEGMAGKKLIQYIGTLPSTDPDLHRYLIAVYEQPKKEPIWFHEEHLESREAVQNRTGFSTRKFAAKYKLGDPIAVYFAFVNFSEAT